MLEHIKKQIIVYHIKQQIIVYQSDSTLSQWSSQISCHYSILSLTTWFLLIFYSYLWQIRFDSGLLSSLARLKSDLIPSTMCFSPSLRSVLSYISSRLDIFESIGCKVRAILSVSFNKWGSALMGDRCERCHNPRKNHTRWFLISQSDSFATFLSHI